LEIEIVTVDAVGHLAAGGGKNAQGIGRGQTVARRQADDQAPKLLADLQRMVRKLDKADVMAGVVVEQEKVDEVGETKWCGAYRPAVEKYKERAVQACEVIRWPERGCRRASHQPDRQPHEHDRNHTRA
jgi:hypothetical protein